MKIDILTLFPNMFDNFLNESIIKRAILQQNVIVNIHNIRDYSKDKNKRVDDYAFGGGHGMVLMCEPIFDAVNDLKKDNTKVIMMTPDGSKYNQSMAYELSELEHIIIICGHYEGFDERIRTIVDLELSIGDYILTGGEIPSMVVADSVIRLLDGVIVAESHQNESFNNNLLDYPNYTKPREFRGLEVPEVLLSGNHKDIDNWRLNESIKKTKQRRPDLLKEGESNESR
jgi:tRNA (guanine37-N1)-methyltransferase